MTVIDLILTFSIQRWSCLHVPIYYGKCKHNDQADHNVLFVHNPLFMNTRLFYYAVSPPFMINTIYTRIRSHMTGTCQWSLISYQEKVRTSTSQKFTFLAYILAHY